MQCPFCKISNNIVKDSREANKGAVIRRRRYCLNCKGRFTTFERIEKKLVVIKKTGIKRPFDRTKILNSITTALRKRNISTEEMNKFADTIILELESMSVTEIKSQTIGKLIMKRLEKLDPIAYIRFASVYKDFNNLSDFAKLINKIKN